MMKDYYLILGLEPNATQEEVKKAFREMSLKYHPDKNKGDKYFEERFKDVKEAYDTLSDIRSRQEYDYQWLRYFRDKEGNDKSQPQENNKTATQPSVQEKRIEDFKAKPKRSYNAVLILIIVGLIIFILILNQQKEDRIRRLSQTVEQLTKDNNEKLADIRFLIDKNEQLNKENEQVQARSKKVAQSVQAKKLPFDVEGLSNLSNNTYSKNWDDIILTRVEWQKETFEGRRQLSAISVLNKKPNTIFDLKLFYEVFDHEGKKVDAGEVLLFEGFDKKGVRQAYNLSGRQVYSNSAVQWTPYHVWIRKKDSEYITFSIQSYDTVD